MFENIKIKTKLIAGFLTVILVFGIGAYFGIQTAQETLKDEIGGSSALLAREILDKIDRDIYYKIGGIYAYSGDLILQKAIEKSNEEFSELDDIQSYIADKDKEWASRQKGEITPFMRELLSSELSIELKAKADFYEERCSYKVFPRIYATNKYGVIVAFTGSAVDYFQADEEWYQFAIKEEGEFWVSDIEYDESSSMYVSNVVVKLHDESGNFSGVLRAVLNVKEMVSVIKNLEQGGIGGAHETHRMTKFKLLTKDGKVIYSTDKFEFFENIKKELFLCLNGSYDMGHMDYFVGKGGAAGCDKEKLFSYAYSDGYRDYKGHGWIFVIEHELQEAFEPINELRNILIVIFLTMISFTILVALYISRSIPKRVAEADRLASLTTKNLGIIIPILQKISTGDFRKKIEIPLQKDEFTELLKALNLMIGDLKKVSQENRQLVSGLEEKVKERTEQLEQAKFKAEMILASIGDGVYAVDKNEKIILFNAAAEKITGWSAKNVIGKKCEKVIKMGRVEDNNNLRKTYCPTDEVFKTGKVISSVSNVFCVSKKDSEVVVSVTAAPIRNAVGKIIGAIAVFRDISRELEIDKMKSEFVSIASHQLRTPLTGIKWLVELLLMGHIPGKLNQEQKKTLNHVYESNERMIKLVNDLLDVSHIETGTKFDINLKQIDLTPIIKSIIKDEADLIKNREIKISLKIPKQWMWKADENKIRQVMQNLTDNAIKYSKIGGSIEIGSDDNEKEVIFYVKDSGVGVPQNQQEKIFEKFFRADNVVNKKEKGTGLGLYIARAIARAHKGNLWFESEENKGSTFYFSLPIQSKKKK